ncbi:MAG: hypothetical protein CL677_05715 [Bdellovibrionaceae bacterium]|nr:hypothetical protein [Pseudobdellovibrionaceae bacterium]|tara:strand:+ start:6247 stop:6756 length:510 start_codon:yes stop_codon:yes gene_type:complete
MKHFYLPLLLCGIFAATGCGGNDDSEDEIAKNVSVQLTPEEPYVFNVAIEEDQFAPGYPDQDIGAAWFQTRITLTNNNTGTESAVVIQAITIDCDDVTFSDSGSPSLFILQSGSASSSYIDLIMGGIPFEDNLNLRCEGELLGWVSDNSTTSIPTDNFTKEFNFTAIAP